MGDQPAYEVRVPCGTPRRWRFLWAQGRKICKLRRWWFGRPVAAARGYARARSVPPCRPSRLDPLPTFAERATRTKWAAPIARSAPSNQPPRSNGARRATEPRASTPDEPLKPQVPRIDAHNSSLPHSNVPASHRCSQKGGHKSSTPTATCPRSSLPTEGCPQSHPSPQKGAAFDDAMPMLMSSRMRQPATQPRHDAQDPQDAMCPHDGQRQDIGGQRPPRARSWTRYPAIAAPEVRPRSHVRTTT